MLRRSASSRSSRRLRLESLESRRLLTAVPFGPEIVIDTNEAADTLVVMADLDGDGDLDMIGGDDGVFWYENTDGNGTFSSPQTIASSAVANNVRDIEVGDIDRDGDLDVLASSVSDSAVQWWANNGSGGFGSAQLISGQSSVGASVELIDYDSDGDLDVLANGDGVDIYANDGSGGFSSNGNFTFAIDFLDTADFNRDGSIDVVAADVANDSITLHTSAGSASLPLNDPGNLIAVDLDGDGDQDVVATSEADGDLVWYENDGSAGSFFASGPAKQVIDSSLGDTFDVRAGDFDADGDLDLLASGRGGTVAWYENDGGASPSFTRHTLTTSATTAENVAIADIDGDGDLDVSYVSAGDNRRVWRRNLAILTGSIINASAEVTIDGNFNSASYVTTADVDGDGDLDVLGAASGADDITWWENTAGDGSVWNEHTLDGNFDGAISVAAADVDGDGDLDVLGAAISADDITWWENSVGDGSTWTEHTIDGDFNSAISVAAADVDGDGDLDVLGAAFSADGITWWENTAGDGSAWTEHTIDGDFEFARSVTAADVDGDGDLDVLGATSHDDDITWWENTAGDGSAWAEYTIDGDFDGAISAAAADVDGDGDLDVLGAAATSDDITWWENTVGDGSAWTEGTIDGDFNSANSVAAADVDGDGDLDVLGAAVFANEITWWENTVGDGSAWTEHTIDYLFDTAQSVTTADVDGDGDLDVLGAALFGNDITWWENRRGPQIAVATTNTAPTQILPGESDDLLSFEVTHLGRAIDGAAELASVALRLESETGSALTSAQANALLDSISLYVDDGNGSFDASDVLVASATSFVLNDGVLEIVSTNGDPNAAIDATDTTTFFVIAELADDSGAQPQNQFRLTHLTTGSATTTAVYAGTTGTLTFEATPNTSSSVVAPAELSVQSIARLDTNPASSSTIRYIVDFDRDVTGVDISDFLLTNNGTVVGTATEVMPLTASSYEVTVSPAAGLGTLRLDLIDDDSIVDAFGNPLGNQGTGNGDFQGEVYDINNVPKVNSITRLDASPTKAETVTYSVVFDRGVTGVDLSDFSLDSTGSAVGSLAQVTVVSPSAYEVTVDSIAGDGALRLDLVDDDSILDADSIGLGMVGSGNGDFSGASYAIDRVDPLVASIVPEGPGITNAESVTYLVDFDEDVFGVTMTDFGLSGIGNAFGRVANVVELSPSQYRVTIDSITGDGTLQLNLVDDDSIVDSLMNPLAGAGNCNGDFSGNAVIIDNTAPNVVGIIRTTPTPTAIGTLTYDVIFDEDVNTINVADFELTTTGTVSGTIQSISGGEDTFTVTISNVAGEGTFRLHLVDADTIVDTAGNELAGIGAGNGDFTGETYTLDHLPPQVLGIVRFDAEAVFGAPLRFLVNFNESVSGVDVTDFHITTTGTASGRIGTITQLLPSSYLVEIDNVAGEGTIGLDLIDDDSIVDTVADPAPLPLGGADSGNGDLVGQAYALAPEPIPGDYDANGVVEEADYDVWQTTYGSTSDTRADGNRDGVVNAADYSVWRDNLGATASPPVALSLAAPDPKIVGPASSTADVASVASATPPVATRIARADAAFALLATESEPPRERTTAPARSAVAHPTRGRLVLLLARDNTNRVDRRDAAWEAAARERVSSEERTTSGEEDATTTLGRRFRAAVKGRYPSV